MYIVVWCTNNDVNFPYYFKHRYYNNKHKKNINLKLKYYFHAFRK